MGGARPAPRTTGSNSRNRFTLRIHGWQPDLDQARAQSVLMSVWRTCWQQGRSALDSLSQLLRGMPVALALPP
jgi:hypothetical protein